MDDTTIDYTIDTTTTTTTGHPHSTYSAIEWHGFYDVDMLGSV